MSLVPLQSFQEPLKKGADLKVAMQFQFAWDRVQGTWKNFEKCAAGIWALESNTPGSGSGALLEYV